MTLNERQKTILQLLREKGRIYVTEVAEQLHYSEMTVRRDLKAMEEDHLLQRCHGGAVEMDTMDAPISMRTHVGDDSKKLLAKKASVYLRDDISVFLDSSSTCGYIVPHIAEHSGITVFTNSVCTLQLLAQYHIPCHVIGGHYYEKDMCMVGSLAEDMAEKINVDVAFFSCAAISSDGRITDKDELQTSVRKKILQNAIRSVMLFDKNKLDKLYLYNVCHRDDLTEVFTL